MQFPRESLNPEELLALLKSARERRTRDWCMILMSYWHGLRFSEVCALTLTDVSDGTLSVQRRQGSLKTKQPLHHDDREPLLDEVTAIQQWLKERPSVRSDVLFVSRNGGELHKAQFFKNFQAAAQAAGLRTSKRHPGILRHSLAAHLSARNIELALIAKALGHRSVNSTVKFVKTPNRRTAMDSLAAVAQETRLEILRLLVRQAPKRLAAGAIARQLRLRRPNLSFHLNVLASAKFIQPHRHGTSISYSARPESLNRLRKFLI